MADEKASQSTNDDDSGITMLDVLEEQEELEDDVNAVLGGSDDQNCTYSKGYVKRQALYACATCTPSDKEPAGICLACSYACHEGHELFELYTKRNFRCDCGNSKFLTNPCRLNQEKEAKNTQNQYNQNFFGKYCTCSRPYPDADDDVADEMIQCICCEDWYHGRHLGGQYPENREYGELICKGCMARLSFLWPYATPVERTTIQPDKTEVKVEVEECTSTKKPELNTPENGTTSDGQARTIEDVAEKVSNIKDESTSCLWKLLPKCTREGPSFWSVGWRQKLCKCPNCMEMYSKHDCLFVVDNEDTVHAYEEKGKEDATGQSQYDKGMLALNSLGRVQQIEAIHEYNSMKSELKEYLRKFADSKKVVREEDIHEFFSNMQARKKQRVDCQVPHFCR